MGLLVRARLTGIGRSAASTLATLAGLLLVNFALLHVAGADWVPDGTGPGSRLEREELQSHVETMRAHYGFDRPLVSRFGAWLARVAVLDFGESTRERRPVTKVIREALPATLLLQGSAIVVTLLIGIGLGTLLGTRAGGLLDRAVGGMLLALFSVPSFWLGTLLVVGLATDGGFKLFPMTGLASDDPQSGGVLDSLWHMTLPVTVLALPGIVVIARLVRASLIELLSSDHVRTALAAGIPRRTVVLRLALRGALVPVAIAFGSMIPALVVGSVVTERIFAIPGIGTLTWDSTMGRDLPVLQALMLLTAVAVLSGFRLADAIAARLDPRTAR